jgi:alpha-beta hydrolase superfamily lysophospholipase
MNRGRARRWITLLTIYLLLCCVVGILITESALHPARRPVPPESENAVRQIALDVHSELEDSSITAGDGATLLAWTIIPAKKNGNAIFLLHGLSDNRLGMLGYAELFLANGFTVIMPDARAHGSSGGELATYGLLEKDDIRLWFGSLNLSQHPRCIFGFGESMGAAQLLQAVQTEPGFCGVVAESPFSDFREVAYDRVGQYFHTGAWLGRTILRPVVESAFLYAHWRYGLLMQEVSPEESVAATAVPVFLIHGKVDGNIPIRHSRRIKVRSPKVDLWEVPNAHHCGAISTEPQQFRDKVLNWLQVHSATKTSVASSRL